MLKLLKLTLYPLSLIYNFFFIQNKNRIVPHSLPVAITISVGNLSVGGTGKTPFILRLLQDLSYTFAPQVVLSRGYGSRLTKQGGIVQVDSHPRDSGDEPLLIKKRFPNTHVIVGRDRIQSFYTFYHSQSSLSPVVLLDDGFQHFAISRDWNIVLIDSSKCLGDGFTLPLGTLREPFEALDRADTIVFTRFNDKILTEKQMKSVQSLRDKIQRKFPEVQIFHSFECIRGLYIHGPEGWYKWEHDSINKGPLSLFAFCGLGNPNAFYLSLESYIGSQFSKRSYPDHHYYTDRDIEYLQNRSERFLICTEKDIVKFRMEDLKRLENRIGYLRMDSEILESNWAETVKTWMGRGRS